MSYNRQGRTLKQLWHKKEVLVQVFQSFVGCKLVIRSMHTKYKLIIIILLITYTIVLGIITVGNYTNKWYLFTLIALFLLTGKRAELLGTSLMTKV